MSQFRIPRRGGANVAFLGVELGDAWILLASIFIALIVGAVFHGGAAAFIGIPVGGYFVNRIYIDWKNKQLPGAVKLWFFARGLSGFGVKIKSQQVVYTGDNTIINKNSGRFLDGIQKKINSKVQRGH